MLCPSLHLHNPHGILPGNVWSSAVSLFARNPANSPFNTQYGALRQKRLRLSTKIRLCEFIILTILLYSAETWCVTEVNRKRLKTFHHSWITRTMSITWKSKVSNETTREANWTRYFRNYNQEKTTTLCATHARKTGDERNRHCGF